MTWLRRILCALGRHGEPVAEFGLRIGPPSINRVCPHCSAIHTDRRPRWPRRVRKAIAGVSQIGWVNVGDGLEGHIVTGVLRRKEPPREPLGDQ